MRGGAGVGRAGGRGCNPSPPRAPAARGAARERLLPTDTHLPRPSPFHCARGVCACGRARRGCWQAAGGPAESGGGSDGPNSGEMAERTVQAFVDLHELAEPLESAAMAQRKQQHRPALEKALERPAKPAAPATLPAPAGGGDWSPERLASVAQRPALSGRDREVLKLAQAALKATVAEASAMTPVENLLLRVP